MMFPLMSPPSGSLNFIASPAEANLTTISSVATFFPLLGVAKVPGSRCLGVGGQGGKGNASGGSRGSARRGSWINCHLSPQILTMDMCSLIQLHLLHGLSVWLRGHSSTGPCPTTTYFTLDCSPGENFRRESPTPGMSDYGAPSPGV